MAKTQLDSDFWRSQVWRRRRHILSDRALWLALLLTAFTVLATPHLPLRDVPIENLATIGFTYAALSFGACVSGAALALGVPGGDRVSRWALIRAETKPFSALSDLVFVFAWAAMAQIAVVITSFLAVALGSGYSVWPAGAIPTHVTLFAVAMFIAWYATLELTAVVRVFVQVAGAIIGEEARKKVKLDRDVAQAEADDLAAQQRALEDQVALSGKRGEREPKAGKKHGKRSSVN